MAILIRRGVGISATSSFAAWNPSDKSANIGLSGSNLTATMNGDGSVDSAVRSDNHVGNRKVYWEVKPTTFPNFFATFFGFGTSGVSLSQNCGFDVSGNSFGWRGNGDTVIAASIALTLPSYAVNDVVQFALDTTGGHSYMWGNVNNGTWTGNGAGDPAAGTNPYNLISFGMTAGDWYAMLSYGTLTNGSVSTANFGSGYTYSAPSGFSNL